MISLCILSIGHDFDKEPMPDGKRKRIMSTIYRAITRFGVFLAGTKLTLTNVDIDYSYYLGPNYLEKYKPIKRTSTIVSNHCSWLDVLILITLKYPAFAPKEFFKSVPVFRTAISVLDSIYIDNKKDEAGK